MIVYRELLLADLEDKSFAESMYELFCVSRKLSIADMREILIYKRPETLTTIAVDTEAHIVVGCCPWCVYYSFGGDAIAIPYDVGINQQYARQQIGVSFIAWGRDICGPKFNLTLAGGPVAPDMLGFYTRLDAVVKPGRSVINYFYPDERPALAQHDDPTIEFRLMTKEDLDSPLVTDIDPNVLGTTDLAALKAVFQRRKMTDTYIAIDKTQNRIVGHAGMNVHYSFNSRSRAVLYDFNVSPGYWDTISQPFLVYARDAVRRKHALTRLEIPADADLASLCERLGMTRTNQVMMYYTYPRRE